MKKTISFCFNIFIFFLFFSCVTTKQIDPKEIQFKEITVEDYYRNYDELAKIGMGYKISNLSLYSLNYEYKKIENYFLIFPIGYLEDKCNMSINFWSDDFYTVSFIKCNATDFVSEKNINDPGLYDRIKSINDNKFFYGNYSIFIYFNETKGYKPYIEPYLYKIEGIPTQEQINECYINQEKKIKELESRIQIVKTEAKKKYIIAKENMDKKIAGYIKGYKYHGYDFKGENEKLFINEALLNNHAYYIFLELDNGMAKISNPYYDYFQPYSQPKYIYKTVYFDNQELKASFVKHKQSAVIVLGTNNIPVIVGIVDEIAGEERDLMKKYNTMEYDSTLSEIKFVDSYSFNQKENLYDRIVKTLNEYETQLNIKKEK